MTPWISIDDEPLQVQAVESTPRLGRREVAVYLLICGGFGCIVSVLIYAFVAWVAWNGWSDITGFERAMQTQGAIAVASLHFFCWVLAIRNFHKEQPSRELAFVTLALGATWLVCGGWLSPFSAYVLLRQSLDSKSPLGIVGVVAALIASIPALSVAASCAGARLSVGSNKRELPPQSVPHFLPS